MHKSQFFFSTTLFLILLVNTPSRLSAVRVRGHESSDAPKPAQAHTAAATPHVQPQRGRNRPPAPSVKVATPTPETPKRGRNHAPAPFLKSTPDASLKSKPAQHATAEKPTPEKAAHGRNHAASPTTHPAANSTSTTPGFWSQVGANALGSAIGNTAANAINGPRTEHASSTQQGDGSSDNRPERVAYHVYHHRPDATPEDSSSSINWPRYHYRWRTLCATVVGITMGTMISKEFMMKSPSYSEWLETMKISVKQSFKDFTNPEQLRSMIAKTIKDPKASLAAIVACTFIGNKCGNALDKKNS